MERCRKRRQVDEHMELLESRKPLLSMIRAKCIQDLPINAVYPNIHDLYVIVEEHDFMDYSKSTMDALRVPFSDVVALWKSKIESKLISLIVNARGSDHVLDQGKVFKVQRGWQPLTTFIMPLLSYCKQHLNLIHPLQT